MSKNLKIIAVIVWTFLVFICGVVVGSASKSTPTPGASSSSRLQTAQHASPTQPSNGSVKQRAGVTMAQFNQLKEGMTYEDVVTILGSPGEQMSSSEIAGTKTVMYEWNGATLGANMNAMFQNNKMASKAQFGLE